MRITAVRTTILGTAWRNLVHVEVDTDDGLVGLGEATLHNFEEAVVAHVVRLQESFDDFAEDYVRASVPGAPGIGSDGSFRLPTAPGLGVTLDHGVAVQHPYRALHFNLSADDWHRRVV